MTHRVKTSLGGELTDRQQLVVAFIRRYIREQGRSPSLREVAAAAGCHRTVAAYHLAELEAAGVIHRTAGQFRSIRLAS